MKPLIVVLSRNYSTGLGVIRSLGQAGYQIDLIADVAREDDCLLTSKSKYVNSYQEIVSKKVKDEEDEALVEALLKYKDSSQKQIILMPTDDYSVGVVDRNRERLEEVFIIPYSADNSLSQCMNKAFQAEKAQQVGLLQPKGWTIDLRQEIIVPDDMIYPCYVKPIESLNGYKREMLTCYNKEELTNHLNKLKADYSNREVLVQEYLDVTKEVGISGVCNKDEIIAPAYNSKQVVAQVSKGVTLLGTINEFSALENYQSKVIEFLRQFQYVGMFDLEFLISNDKVYFNEVNFRCGGPNYAYYKCGFNMPEVAVKALLGEPITSEDVTLTADNQSFVYEKVALEDYQAGYIDKQQFEAYLQEADIYLIRDDEDPLPWEEFKLKNNLS